MDAEATTDVRVPIGGLFAVLGVIVAGFGLMTAGDTARYARSEGININLWWGVVMLVFGVVLLAFARRGRRGAALPGGASDRA